MNFKKSVRYKTLLFWSILLLVFSGALLHTESYFEDLLPGHEIPVAGIIRLNFNRAQLLLKGDSAFKKVYAALNNKTLKYRKKYKRLIEGNDDQEVFTRTIQYGSHTERFLRINYQRPYFVSQQHAFLFRHTVF